MARLLADTTPLRESRPFARVFFGLTLANIGSQLTVTAVSLEVYDLTQDTFYVGLLGLFALVPLVVLGLYGGALADAHDRRRVALFASFGMWIATIGIALHAWLGMHNVWLLYSLVALQSAAAAVNAPARSAIVPRLLRPQLLPAANALMGIQWNVALMGGPLVGAGLVALIGYAPTYTIDVVTFTAALFALFKLPAIPPNQAARAADERGWRSVLVGLRFLATRPNIRMTFLLDLAAMIFAQPTVVFPAVGAAMIGGGKVTTGALTMAIATGSVIAGVLSGPVGRIRRQGKAVSWSVTCWGAAIAMFGIILLAVGHTEPPGVIWWAMIAACLVLAFAGGSDNISMVMRNTMLQAAVPDELRGRLQGVFTVVVAGGPRLGQMLVGSLSAAWGEGLALTLGGLICLVAVWLLMAWQPRFMAYDARHPEP